METHPDRTFSFIQLHSTDPTPNRKNPAALHNQTSHLPQMHKQKAHSSHPSNHSALNPVSSSVCQSAPRRRPVCKNILRKLQRGNSINPIIRITPSFHPPTAKGGEEGRERRDSPKSHQIRWKWEIPRKLSDEAWKSLAVSSKTMSAFPELLWVYLEKPSTMFNATKTEGGGGAQYFDRPKSWT